MAICLFCDEVESAYKFKELEGESFCGCGVQQARERVNHIKNQKIIENQNKIHSLKKEFFEDLEKEVSETTLKKLSDKFDSLLEESFELKSKNMKIINI